MEKILYTPNRTDEEHLEAVKQKMKEYGSPEIEIVQVSNVYVALEGSHRVRAAAELKIPVQFTEVDPEAPCQHDDLIGWDEDKAYTNKEVAEGILFSGAPEEFDISNNIPVFLGEFF